MEIQSFKRMTARNVEEADDSPIEEPVEEEEISKSPPRGERRCFRFTEVSQSALLSLLLVLAVRYPIFR